MNQNSRRFQLISLAALLILGGAGLVVFSLRKPVSLVIDEVSTPRVTWAWTVGGLLSEAGVGLAPQDRLSPPAEASLKKRGVVQVQRARRVVIRADGRQSSLFSAERIPANLLAEAGVRLFPGDLLLVDGRPAPALIASGATAAARLHLRRAVPVSVEIGGERVDLRSTAVTLGSALWQAEIALYAGDRLQPGPETPLAQPLQANLAHSRPVMIVTAGLSATLRTAAPTVGEALAEAGLALQGLDRAEPAAEAALPADGVIRLVRVREEVLLEQKPVPFESTFEAAPELPLDQQKIVQTGQYGLEVQRVRVRYEDGQEVSRAVEGSWLAQAPRPRVVGYGTQVVQRTVDTPDGPITYWRAVQMYATSYSPCRLGIPNYCNDVTASGARLGRGIAAVTRSWYAYFAGARVYVPGYGQATIADIGAGVPGRYFIDLGYSDADFVSWARTVTVYFLWPPPANIPWTLP
jgi:uncharacterized protein YabE (DUF348 family)